VPAVLILTFDPVLSLGDTASVRLEIVALAAVLFAGLALAGWLASRSRTPELRLDDLAFMVVGAVPGAVVGGRLGYVLDHLDFYRANPTAILDPGQGALTLTLAVPLGLLSGGIIARLLGAPIGRWMHSVAPPLLFTLAAGKLVGVLGASGQGAPADVSWATAYAGPGPWGSLAADVPSHPSQAYEAILVGLVVVVLGLISRTRLNARGNGATLFVALGLWAAARFAVAFTWRDPLVVGPLRMEQLLLLGLVIVAVIGLTLRYRSPFVEPVPGPIEPEDEPPADAAGEADPA
jgi:phosphatidylglycerol---prolipoprotein diacylglyceryl transferase